MRPSLKRRGFLIGTAAGLASFPGLAAATQHANVTSQFRDIERVIGGRLGIAALNTANGVLLSHRANERFAMCSTFKWLLAALVLFKADHGQLRLDQSVSYSRANLLSHSPVTESHVNDGAMSIEGLCEAVMSVSDNGAANLLLHEVGGPPGVTALMRNIGDTITRLDRTEPALNTNLPDDPHDTTTPAAMIATMNKIILGDVLSQSSREKLQKWLKSCQTGLQRLRAGLPSDWSVGDKTGTGANSAANDIAIAWPPQRPAILIAVYLSGSRTAAGKLDAAHAQVARVISKHFAA